ncbi:MAG: HAD hydrolase-like protein [Xanthomonadales bacterium]|nr:HAD hydrolase-like protein [Gammaproteobacteria bacterium]MBT8051348.1 HAD hydrolase-like protein [Gammaproteobacteria bacterium]MBT8057363.1 HAD hydrolase-like protein [Gammaproteobacteria bacterium]NNJ80362.1 HAD hydrolase-like protein [Xanthomonadales bacterium]NNL04024.1 HAD hydrolase-like protein [Xanthomonadales bacterium]
MPGLRFVDNVLFDLDGTLVDSSRTIVDAIEHALNTLDVAPGGVQVERLIGQPLYDIFMKTYGLPRERALQAIDVYREHYDRLNQSGTRVYDGVREGLAGLRAEGYGLYIATVKPTPIADKVLLDLGLRKHFNGVAGASMGPERRDKQRIIAWALNKFDLDPNTSLMVGDRDQDVEGARGNGLASVAVHYGFGQAEELRRAQPDHTADCFQDVVRLVLGEPVEDKAVEAGNHRGLIE